MFVNFTIQCSVANVLPLYTPESNYHNIKYPTMDADVNYGKQNTERAFDLLSNHFQTDLHRTEETLILLFVWSFKSKNI